MSHPPSTFALTDSRDLERTLVNSAPAGRGGLPLAAAALLGSYEEALSVDMDEDNMGCMTQNGPTLKEEEKGGSRIGPQP
jgi:hypothetical protein